MHRPAHAGRKLLQHMQTAAHMLEGGAKFISTAKAIYEGGKALAPIAAALI